MERHAEDVLPVGGSQRHLLWFGVLRAADISKAGSVLGVQLDSS